MIKCVAVIKEFYRKADKVQVNVFGRKRSAKKFELKKNLQKEVDLYEDWTKEDWPEEGLPSRSALKAFPHIIFSVFLKILLLQFVDFFFAY